MSWTGRVVELVGMGMSQADAYAFVAREREAADANLPSPELPPRVLESLGQQQLFAPECWDEEAAA